MYLYFSCKSKSPESLIYKKKTLKRRFKFLILTVAVNQHAILAWQRQLDKIKYIYICLVKNIMNQINCSIWWRLSCEGSTHQDPLDEHIIILLSELRSAQYKLAQQLHSCLSHTGGVVHQTAMYATLHIRLRDRKESLSTKKPYFTQNTASICCPADRVQVGQGQKMVKTVEKNKNK